MPDVTYCATCMESGTPSGGCDREGCPRRKMAEQQRGLAHAVAKNPDLLRGVFPSGAGPQPGETNVEYARRRGLDTSWIDD